MAHSRYLGSERTYLRTIALLSIYSWRVVFVTTKLYAVVKYCAVDGRVTITYTTTDGRTVERTYPYFLSTTVGTGTLVRGSIV